MLGALKNEREAESIPRYLLCLVLWLKFLICLTLWLGPRSRFRHGLIFTLMRRVSIKARHFNTLFLSRGIRLSLLLSWALILISAQHSWAGAWNAPKNSGQIIVTGEFARGNSVFTDDSSQETAAFSKTETRVFAEHGLHERWTLSVNTALEMSQFQSEQSQFSFDDFGDTAFGLRYQIKRDGKSALSAQLSYIIDGGPADNILDINGARDNLEFRALWGRDFFSEKYGDIYIDAQIAGRFRLDNGGYQSTHLDLTLGYKPSEKWSIFLQNFSTLREAESDQDFRVEEQVSVKSSLSLGYRYKRGRMVQVGYGQTVFGRNTVKERSLFISTWLSY